MFAMQPGYEWQKMERMAFEAWLHRDLSTQAGPLDPVPGDLLALIEASALPH